MSLDSLLESALEVSLASHPNPQSVYGLAERLRRPVSTGVQSRVSALLDGCESTTIVLMAMANSLELNGAESDARCLRLFAQRFSLLEAAGQ